MKKYKLIFRNKAHPHLFVESESGLTLDEAKEALAKYEKDKTPCDLYEMVIEPYEMESKHPQKNS